MKKKNYIPLAAIILSGCMLSGGCGNSTEKISQNNNAEEISASPGEIQKEVSHIVMTFPTTEATRLGHAERVIQEINERTREKIGVEVEMQYIDASESAETYPLWITQGKTIDLMVLNYQDITPYAEQSMVLPLDDLLENAGSDIIKISEEWGDLFSGGTIKNQKYGIAMPSDSIGHCNGLWVPVSYLKEINFSFEEGHIYSLKELDSLFEAMKEKHPDRYPLGITVKPYDFTVSGFFQTGYNAARSSMDTGVIWNDDPSHTVVDYYETEQYQNWLGQIREWYLKGYIHPDAAISTSPAISLLKDKIIMSIPQNGNPYFYTEEEIGEEAVCLQLTPNEYGPYGTKGIYWMIPATSREPEAAMKFLNLMFTDPEIVNLLEWGIEGEDYQKIKEGVVIYPEGKDRNTVEYFNPLGLFGDQRLRYSFESDEEKKVYQEFSKRAKSFGFEYSAFSFDPSSLSVELSQIQGVLERYLDVLETGSVDLDIVYPKFVQELQDAGMQKVIAEKQRQLDAFFESTAAGS